MSNLSSADTTFIDPKNSDLGDLSLYKRIAMGGPAPIVLLEMPDYKIRFVNRCFEEFFGYTSEDLAEQGITFRSLLGEHQLPRFINQLSVAREDKTSISRFIIYNLNKREGGSCPFYLYISLERDLFPEKEIYQLLLHQNVSRWSMPFTSFNTRELFLEQFLGEDFGTFEWILAVDKVFLSPGVYKIYELDDISQELDNQFINAFTHPADREAVAEASLRGIENGGTVDIEYRIVTAKGNIKRLHCLARAIRNKEGVPVKYVGSIRDITELRSIEDDLKNKVEELNHSNKELEEFAYVASHDMQEPLRKITTFSDRLAEKYKGVLEGDGAMYLSRMISSAENMRMLINDLLEFSKITKTQQPFEPVDLNISLQQVKNDLELTIEETATVINNDPLPEIDAIRSQMKQLLLNIISNGIKFRKPGVAPVISINSEVLSLKDKVHFELPVDVEYYKIQITDNGIGFDEEYAARIFQVFQRLHGKSEYPGSGIGLAICKKILEYHKGLIYAQNIPGTGARFVFVLPAKQVKKTQANL